jgi:hypothetical protein
MTPNEQLESLNAEIDRLHSEHPNMHGILRLPDTYLVGCSKWKWEQHGWTISDQQVCGIMNGNERERRTALLSVLKERMIERIEFVSGADALEILPDLPAADVPQSKGVCGRADAVGHPK